MFLAIVSYGQKHDFNWLFGRYDLDPNRPTIGRVLVDFNQDSIQAKYHERKTNFRASNFTMSDRQGKLLFYSNGIYIEDANGEVVEGSQYLNPGWHTDGSLSAGIGNNMPNSIVCLPISDNDTKFAIIHQAVGLTPDFTDLTANVLYSEIYRIDTSESFVVERLNDTIDLNSYGLFAQAVRHGNGRDWWVIFPQDNFSCKHLILQIGQQGIKEQKFQCFGEGFMEGEIGSALFISSSNQYIRYASVVDAIDFFDFDRCNGTFYGEAKRIYLQDSLVNAELQGGLAISPNERFAYVSSKSRLFQYDLWADDIEASRITIVEASPSNPDHRSLWLGQLAPDGKIYWNTRSNFDAELHVIHEPDRLGADCDFRFRDFSLIHNNSRTLPQIPNYRLGPLDGSLCDTLGIDNVPVAYFRWEEKGEGNIDFRNLSHHEPEEHFWEFGDGETSDEFRPVYSYSDTGTYHVCLTVSNPYGMDTYCRDVKVTKGTVSIFEEPETKQEIRVYPNPTSDYLVIQFPEIGSYQIRLFDTLGRLVFSDDTEALNYQLWLGSFTPGMYVLEVRDENSHLVQIEKVLKL